MLYEMQAAKEFLDLVSSHQRYLNICAACLSLKSWAGFTIEEGLCFFAWELQPLSAVSGRRVGPSDNFSSQGGLKWFYVYTGCLRRVNRGKMSRTNMRNILAQVWWLDHHRSSPMERWAQGDDSSITTLGPECFTCSFGSFSDDLPVLSIQYTLKTVPFHP